MNTPSQQTLVCEACREASSNNNCIATLILTFAAFVIGFGLGAIFL